MDLCGSCSGVWLDKGEIYHYSRDPQKLFGVLAHAYKTPTSRSRYLCMRCDSQMYEVKIENGPLIDVCAKCGGTWFDSGEVKTLNSLLDRPVHAAASVAPAALAAGTPPSSISGRVTRPLSDLPSLGLRSAAVLGFLYAVFLGFSALVVALAGLPLGHVFTSASIGILLSFLLNPFLLDFSLKWMHSLRWVQPAELPPHLRAFLQKSCAAKGVPVPHLGIIEDGTPNAFTYGHVPSNARLVVTRGLMAILDEGELEAVIGHELGHIVHWDMLIMTAAAVVPLILREIYEGCRRIMRKSRGRSSGGKKGGNPIPLIMVTALVLYWITKYVVLFLSRVRELHADRFAGELTRKPNDLSSALLKIAYGMAGRAEPEQEGKAQSPSEAVGALGIFDETGAAALAAASSGGRVSAADASAAMGWDLHNPWAAYFELHSSHPLPAKRIRHLSRQAEAYGQKPLAAEPAAPGESLLDEFAIDLLILWLPWLLAGISLAVDVSLGAVQPLPMYARAGMGWALGQLVKLKFSYPTGFFADATAAGLLKRLKVSGVRGVPVALRGRVMGRGQPGYVFSEDFAIQDATGFVLVDYRQPFALFQLIFALRRVRSLIGQEVTVFGWYRRAPVPYIELSRMLYPGEESKSYSLIAQYAFAAAALVFCAWLRMTA